MQYLLEYHRSVPVQWFETRQNSELSNMQSSTGERNASFCPGHFHGQEGENKKSAKLASFTVFHVKNDPKTPIGLVKIKISTQKLCRS